MIRKLSVASLLTAAAGLAGAQNLIPNPDLEEGDTFLGLPDAWQKTSNPAGAWTTAQNRTPGGQFSVSVAAEEGFHNWELNPNNRAPIEQVPPVGLGGVVTLSLWYNMPEPVTSLVVGAKVDWFTSTGSFISSSGDLIIEARDTDGWEQITFTEDAAGNPLLPPRGAAQARVMGFTFDPEDDEVDADGTIFFDDFELTQADATPPCSIVDVAATDGEFGTLDGNDIAAFIRAFIDSGDLIGPNENRLTNPSLEMPAMDEPDVRPEGWATINNVAGGYETGGVDGAPPAFDGDRLISVSPEEQANGMPGGFNSWNNFTFEDTSTYIPLDQNNPITVEFYYNLPDSIVTNLLGVKLEYAELGPDGEFIGLRGQTGDIIIQPSLAGNVVEATDGWVFARFTVDPMDISPAATHARLLVFTFDGGDDVMEFPPMGKAYFDAFAYFQAESPSPVADLAPTNGEFGQVDGNDIAAFVQNFLAGCP